MERDEFKRLFRNALDYFHGRELDDDELDTLTDETAEKVELQHVNLKWYSTPNHLARLVGTTYLEERQKKGRGNV